MVITESPLDLLLYHASQLRDSISILRAGGENDTSMQDYNPLWVSELRRTNAYEVWERVTDPLIFDITEPR